MEFRWEDGTVKVVKFDADLHGLQHGGAKPIAVTLTRDELVILAIDRRKLTVLSFAMAIPK